MILRSLAEALREQNWFTVVLEILIVVVGIFIGLQVDDWNDLRRERVEEKQFFQELRLEVEREIFIKESRLADNAAYLELLEGAVQLIQGEDSGLDVDQCRAITASHQIGNRVDIRGLLTYDALAQSGRLHIISDPAKKQLLSDYARFIDLISVRTQFIGTGAIILSNEHAEMFPRNLSPGEATAQTSCRLDLIRASVSARNNLLSNHSRFALLGTVHQDQLDRLHGLLELLSGAVQ